MTYTQQSIRVYTFEDDFLPSDDLSDSEATEFAHEVWEAFGTNAGQIPTMNFGLPTGEGIAWYDEDDHSINIPSFMMTTVTIAHELAHAIVQNSDIITRDEIARFDAHGPEFVGVASVIYNGIFGMDIAEMVEMFDNLGIMYDMGRGYACCS